MFLLMIILNNHGDNDQNKKKNSKKDRKFNNIKTKNNEHKNEKKGKKNKKYSDKDSFLIEDWKSFKEDENEFSYNNLKNFLLSDSINFYNKDILSEKKIEIDILNSYSNKQFLITNISNCCELKKMFFDEKIAFKLKLRKYKINAIIEKVRFDINNLDIDYN